jgi:hypothetical protein
MHKEQVARGAKQLTSSRFFWLGSSPGPDPQDCRDTGSSSFQQRPFNNWGDVLLGEELNTMNITLTQDLSLLACCRG